MGREHFGQPLRDEYERDFTLILHELSYARNAYFIFKKLEAFPKERMWPYVGPLFRVVQTSLFRQILLSLWKVIYDTDGSVTTIRKLRNQFFSNDSISQLVLESGGHTRSCQIGN